MNTIARALALCGAVVALDQLSKGLVTIFIDRGTDVAVLPFLELTNVRNRGIAFGLFGDASPVLIGLTVVALVGVLAFLASGASEISGPRVWISAGLLIGGALGNLADRVRIDAVIDFIDVPLWPTFNLADTAIVAGVFCLVLLPGESSPARGP